MSKRVVLEYTTGVFKGLWQILGTDDQLKEGLKVEELPSFVSPVQFIDHVGACSLVTVKPRYILYRELIVPDPAATSKTFHPAQL